MKKKILAAILIVTIIFIMPVQAMTELSHNTQPINSSDNSLKLQNSDQRKWNFMVNGDSDFIPDICNLSRYVDKTGKHVTHLGVAAWFVEKNSVKVFYSIFSPTQKSLASQGLNIIYNEYKICSEILNVPIEKLYAHSMVFCKSSYSPFVLRCGWWGYVDGIVCWHIAGEKSMEFKDTVSVFMLYHTLPHELVDMSLRVRGIDYVYGGWFIEGAAEYAALICGKNADKLNGSYNLNWINTGLNNLSGQEGRIVDLSNRSSFAGFGAPYTEDEYVFYMGSLVYIYDLVKKYGDGFISDVVANNCTSYESIRSSIENSTGYDIDDSIKNVSVGWIKQHYISILEEFNINYQ